MRKIRCITCGTNITKVSFRNPYMCRYCGYEERSEETTNTYMFLDPRP